MAQTDPPQGASMRALFPGHYRPTHDDFGRLWTNAVFSFDANVLLNLYRYSEKTRDSLLTIIEVLRERVWIPHQSAFEYQSRRLNVISQQAAAYDRVTDGLNKFCDALHKQHSLHPYFDSERVADALKKALEAEIDGARKAHPDLMVEDQLRDRLTALLEARVGPPFDEKRQAEVLEDAQRRLKNKIPPGFEDAEKTGDKRFGDVVIWWQLIEFSNTSKKPLIFVTDDRKEDWWWKHQGRTIGPRPELVAEFLAQSGQQFYMYQTAQFMEQAKQFLKVVSEGSAIEEVKEVASSEVQVSDQDLLLRLLMERDEASHWKLLKKDLKALQDPQSRTAELKINHGIRQADVRRTTTAAIQTIFDGQVGWEFETLSTDTELLVMITPPGGGGLSLVTLNLEPGWPVELLRQLQDIRRGRVS